MSKPIVRVARKGHNAITASDVNLSFSSEWKTPKIFKQTSSNWTNTLGYIPSFMGFRRLNSTVPIGEPGIWGGNGGAGEFGTKDYTHSLPALQGAVGTNGITFINDNLSIIPYSGYWGDYEWEDESGHALLILDPLNGEIPESYTLGAGGVFLLGSGGVEVRTDFPYNNSVDTRFDTFKIFKTGTLVLSLPAETILADADPVSHETSLTHDLGYPPVYLPSTGVGWNISDATYPLNFVLNDYLGKMYSGAFGKDEEPLLSVWVDSEKLYMKVYRFSRSFGADRNYSARELTMYYTIFYNEIGEEFNMLDI